MTFAQEAGTIVIYVAYALVGMATFLISRTLMREQESRAAEEGLEELRDRKASSALVRITRPFFTQYVVPMVRRKAFWDRRRHYYRRKLITAGLKEELTPDEFIAFKIFQIVFFPIVLGLLTALDLIDVHWFFILLSGALGWFYPDFWVKRRIEFRQSEIRKALPFITDLLALSTEAGLDFMGAIGKVVEKAAPSPLVEEFEQVLKEIKVGASRAEGLREMATRIDMQEVSSFIAILISADQMGASIGRVLRQQSEQIRNDRFVRAEKAGAIAAQKLLLPMAIFVLPAVLLMVFGPFILGFIYPS